MSTSNKDTIYIDIDDEITAIIEKVQAAKSKVVAVVLPKRAAVMQSTVNMRLLKRAADDSKKNLVLITSEAALLPLAGAVGIHVARSLQSKPAVPPAPEVKDQPLTISSDEAENDAMETVDPKTPIGTLAGDAVSTEVADETIDVDNTESEVAGAATKAKKPKADKKLKVPNFERFRKWILLGGIGLVVFIIFLVWAFVVAPKAKITVKTDTTTVSSSLDMIASPSAKSVDSTNKILPAAAKQVQKADSTKASATGQQNNGNKATGNATLSLTDCSQASVTVPSGTTISSNSLNFITQSSATLVSTIKGGKCSNQSDAQATVPVVAQNAGDNYNLSARSYSVSSFSNVSASGTAMTGGTNQIVKIVSQSDVDTAKQQLLDKLRTAAISDLNKQFATDHMFALSDSTAPTGDVSVTAAPDVGQQADQTTVNITVTYSMLGMQQDDMKQLIEADIKTKIDTNAQKIQDSDDGLSKATVKLADKKSNGDVPFNLQVQVMAGAQQNADAIKQIAIGRKKGDAQDQIKQRPGVKDAKIQYSPFWVTTTPKKASKITVVFEQADGSK